MNPSKAATISSRLSIAWGFSILAMTGRKIPSSFITARTSSTSLADRTKDSAMKSTVRCSAKRRSSLSFSDSAGTDTATPGRLMPLLSLAGPPTTTFVCTSSPSTEVTSRRTLPSSTRIGSPAFTSPGRPAYVVEQIDTSPGTSRVVMVNEAPFSSSTGPSANRPSRIFGPWRSARTPTPRPEASEASRTRVYARLWSAWDPWLKFSRATSMPASTSLRTFFGEEVAGPRVQTILALRTRRP